MLFPLTRRSATTWRISEIFPTTCISEAVIRVRICAAANLARLCSDCRAHLGRHLRVALEELGLKGVVESEHVGEHQHLAVATGPGADANRRNPDRGGDARGNCRRHQLQNDPKSAGLLETFRLGDQTLGPLFFAPLTPRAADGVDRLRS